MENLFRLQFCSWQPKTDLWATTLQEKGNIKPDGFSIKSSCKKNGNGRPDGFSIIINHILTHTISLVVQIDQNRKKNKELEIEKRLTSAALLLVRAVLKAGKILDTYIQSHPEVLNCL